MDYATKRQLVEIARLRMDALSDQKGKEYTQEGDNYQSGGDVLANFKNNAARFGSSPLTVLGIYLGKHLDSIFTFTSEVAECESYEEAQAKVLEGEGIISRLDDARNYLDLFEALLFEYNLHPFSFTETNTTTEEIEAPSSELDLPADDVAAEVEEAMDAELAEYKKETPFKGSSETGVG